MLFWMCTTLGKPGSISAGFQRTGSTPAGIQEDFRVISLSPTGTRMNLCDLEQENSGLSRFDAKFMVKLHCSPQAKKKSRKYKSMEWRDIF